MIGLKNKFPQSKIFLTTFELKEIVIDDLYNLKHDTSEEKYEKILNSINFIYLEDYVNKPHLT